MNRVGVEDLSEEQREELEIAGRERARNILVSRVESSSLFLFDGPNFLSDLTLFSPFSAT